MIAVVGSANVDLVTRVERIPRPGETVAGSTHCEFFGGKGANEAVCIARLGGRVAFVGAVGAEDEHGNRIVSNLTKEGVDVRRLTRVSQQRTGLALVTVSDKEGGENTVIVVPGANGHVSGDYVLAALRGERGGEVKAVMCQNEIPLASTAAALRHAKSVGALSFWNPAPAPPLSQQVHDVLSLVDVLCVNETEAEQLSGGLADLEQAITVLCARVRHVIITLGSRGCMWMEHGGGSARLFSAAPLGQCGDGVVVDTTGAGDCFCGTLVWALITKKNAEGDSIGQAMPHAIELASRAAAFSVQRHGAQSSYPRFDQV